METPWGDTDNLRAARLHPGIQPNGRAATASHQRRRIFAWIVATVARDGYDAARMEDLLEGSGVAHSGFYKLFEDKEQCFLEAVDVFYEEGLQRMWAAYRSQRGVEAALYAALAALLEAVVAQPAAARAALVHLYEIGERGVARAARARASLH
ncbi:MAG: TetR/AcrR family transcriptional regulator, partial [Solirubrobacteraceae bacterium]